MNPGFPPGRALLFRCCGCLSWRFHLVFLWSTRSRWTPWKWKPLWPSSRLSCLTRLLLFTLAIHLHHFDLTRPCSHTLYRRPTPLRQRTNWSNLQSSSSRSRSQRHPILLLGGHALLFTSHRVWIIVYTRILIRHRMICLQSTTKLCRHSLHFTLQSLCFFL